MTVGVFLSLSLSLSCSLRLHFPHLRRFFCRSVKNDGWKEGKEKSRSVLRLSVSFHVATTQPSFLTVTSPRVNKCHLKKMIFLSSFVVAPVPYLSLRAVF